MLSGLRVHEARPPMRVPFTHAAAARRRAESVLVRVDLDGHTGWGEGAPRPYVTGETLATAVAALAAVELRALDAAVDWSDFAAAVAGIARLDLPRLVGGGRRTPAAAAGLELALLDALCRRHHRTVHDALTVAAGHPDLLHDRPVPVPVALVVDLSRDPAAFLGGLAAATRAALTHVKVKVAADPVSRVRAVRAALGDAPAISIDANGVLAAADLLPVADRLRELGVCWIEEPYTRGRLAELRALSRGAGLPVMLDESCVDLDDLDTAVAADAVDLVNVRVSKCGGLLPSLAMLCRARAAGLGSQVGVQVGEVGPLWAAGRHLATGVRGLATVEAGRQDEWFDPPTTDPPYTIDRSRHVVPPLPGPGLGVRPAFHESWSA